jgi:quinol monooxygenase YgiN
MIVVTASFQAKEGKEEELEQAFRAMFPLVRTEAGVITYILHRSTDNRGKFFFYEQYKDKDAFDYHGATPYFKDLIVKVKDLVTGPPAVGFYEEVEAIKR